MERMNRADGELQIGRKRGLAAVEAALLMPLLLLIVMGIIEYGWLFFAFHVTSSAAREGCRVAVTRDATAAHVTATINSRMAAGGFGGFDVEYAPSSDPAAVEAGEDYTVEVTLTYDSLTNFALIPVPETLSSRVIMRKEGPLFPGG